MGVLLYSIIISALCALGESTTAEGPLAKPQFVKVRLEEYPLFGNAFDGHGLVYLAYYQHARGEPVGAAHILSHEEWTGRRACVLTGAISRSLHTRHDQYDGKEPFETLNQYMYDGQQKRWVLMDGVSYARFGGLLKGANATTQKHDEGTYLLLHPH